MPEVRSSGVMMPAAAEAYAPPKPAAMLKTTRNGVIVIRPAILGNTRNEAELTPIISSASICWVTRIVPISEAMLLPTLPARMRHMMLLENSSSSISLVV